jgi:Arc/MetJ-type ribon-helix-helix transcriptional regulator
MYGMKKTTLYLPEDLKNGLERVALQRGTSEAEVVREALANLIDRAERPRPRVPLTGAPLGDSSLAERADELLDGFGET